MPISNKYIIDRAKKITKKLSDLNHGDAVWVLETAINFIVGAAHEGGNVNLSPRHPGPPKKIVKDVELRQFIHQLDTFYTIEKLQKLLVAKFGGERAPSKNTLSKYIKTMSQSEPVIELGHANSISVKAKLNKLASVEEEYPCP